MPSAGKLAHLSMALAGRFTGHHALLCRLHLDRIKMFDDAVDGLDKQIAGRAARWRRDGGMETGIGPRSRCYATIRERDQACGARSRELHDQRTVGASQRLTGCHDGRGAADTAGHR